MEECKDDQGNDRMCPLCVDVLLRCVHWILAAHVYTPLCVPVMCVQSLIYYVCVYCLIMYGYVPLYVCTMFTCLIDNFDVHKTCIDCIWLLPLHASAVEEAIEHLGSERERPTMQNSITMELHLEC